MDTDKIILLLNEYNDSIEHQDREKLYQITNSIHSIIVDYFPASDAFKADLTRIRNNVFMLVSSKRDIGISGITLEREKKSLKTFIDTLVNQVSKIGLPNSTNNSIDNSITLHVSQNQEQTQKQKQVQKQIIEIFIESIRDEISGKQFKELKEIAKEEKDPQKAKNKILESLKRFGVDICSNIITNIITNPSIWHGFDLL